MRILATTATAACLSAALAFPAGAIDVSVGGVSASVGSGGVSASVGGSGGVNASVGGGGISASVGGDGGVNTSVGDEGIKASIGGGGGIRAIVGGGGGTRLRAGHTYASVDLLGRNGVLDADVRSRLLGGINAKLDVLSNRNLLKLCLNVGGGDACRSGSRSKLINLIEARLKVLGSDTLASLCLSVGATGCGGQRGTGGGPGGGGGGSGGGGGGSGGGGGGSGGSVDLSDFSASERNALQKRCPDVVRRPYKYDKELFQLCTLVVRL